MAEMLAYAPDLRSITQGQGDYTLELLRYEPAPSQLAKKVLEQLDEARQPRTLEGFPAGSSERAHRASTPLRLL